MRAHSAIETPVSRMMSRASRSVLVECCIASAMNDIECTLAGMYFFVYIIVEA